MNLDILVGQLLAVLPVSEHDRLVPLLGGSEELTEKLTRKRPHRSAVHRWASKGTGGVRLAVVRVGAQRFTSARMLCAFFAAAGAPKPEKKTARRPGSQRAVKATPRPTKAGGAT